MLTWGLIVLIVNLLYVLFAFIVSKVAKHFLSKYYRHIGTIVFIIVLLAPFWDLFIQKGIKTYYQVFDVGTAIYAYPEKDKDGKIESLGIGKMDSVISNYFFNQEKITKYGMEKKKFISGFVERYIFDSFEEVINKRGDVEYKKIKDVPMGYIRLYLNKNLIYYEKIKDESEYKARYQVKNIIDKGYFYDEVVSEFWDTNKNILLAKSIGIGFNNGDHYNNKFRNRYLLWKASNGVPFAIEGTGSYRQVYNKLFFKTQIEV